MTIKLFETPAEAAESAPELNVSMVDRLIFCALAALVAVVPAITAAYSAYQVTLLFRSMKNAESARTARVLSELHISNTPLVIALGLSAFLAFGIALILAVDQKRRPASVGLPFAIGVPIIAAVSGLFLWGAETTTIDILSGKLSHTPIAVLARTVGLLLLCAIVSGVLAIGGTFVCSVVSLCIPVQRRADAFSLRRAFVWAVAGTLLLVFAGAYFVVV